MQSTSDDSERLLVVDDDAIQGCIIGNIGEQMGYRVMHASTLEAAVEVISAQPFACITVDLRLGDRDGIELLRYIARFASVPKVVIVSGCEERILTSTVRMAESLGIPHTVAVAKPLDPAELRKALAGHERSGCNPKPSTRPAEKHVEHAMQKREIYPVFQPKVELATGRVVGCEALARWISPAFGHVAAELFIPAVERSNDIKALTLMLLEDSVVAAKSFCRRDPDFTVAVNLSAALLADIALPEEIEKVLLKHQVPARSLVLEVTESVAMSDVSRAMDILLRLRIKGIGVSMDDFGTGYSSFAALARLPFSEIKIDKSFVTHCLTDGDLWRIVRGSVALGHEFRMKVVAEGVEDAATLQALAGIGCDAGQGFHFSRALPAEDFALWYDRWQQAPRVLDVAGAARL